MNKSRLSHTRCDNTKMECQIHYGRTAVHNTKLSSPVFSAEKQHNLPDHNYITTRPSHCRPGTTLSHCSTADAVSITIKMRRSYRDGIHCAAHKAYDSTSKYPSTTILYQHSQTHRQTETHKSELGICTTKTGAAPTLGYSAHAAHSRGYNNYCKSITHHFALCSLRPSYVVECKQNLRERESEREKES